MIISINTEKDLTNSNRFTIKKSPEIDIKESYFSIIKAIYGKPTTNIFINDGKLKAFPLKPRTRQGVHSHHYYSKWLWKSYLQQLVNKKK